MAAIKFTASDVRRILQLPDSRAVEHLIQKKVLDISAYTRTGQPLFDVDTVRRAATHIAGQGEMRSQ